MRPQADTISYSAKKGDFDRYFRKVVDRNKVCARFYADQSRTYTCDVHAYLCIPAYVATRGVCGAVCVFCFGCIKALHESVPYCHRHCLRERGVLCAHHRPCRGVSPTQFKAI